MTSRSERLAADLARVLVAAVGVERARALLDECGPMPERGEAREEPSDDDMRRAEGLLRRVGVRVA